MLLLVAEEHLCIYPSRCDRCGADGVGATGSVADGGWKLAVLKLVSCRYTNLGSLAVPLLECSSVCCCIILK